MALTMTSQIVVNSTVSSEYCVIQIFMEKSKKKHTWAAFSKYSAAFRKWKYYSTFDNDNQTFHTTRPLN